MSKAVRKGGQPLASRLWKSWETGRYATWKFKIFYKELEVERLKEENGVLRGKKRKLEDEVETIAKENKKIQEKLDDALATNKKAEGQMKKKFKLLTQKLIRQQRKSLGGSSKAKKFCDYSKRHQRRLRKQMVSDCEVSLGFLGLQDFIATKVEVFNQNTQQFDTINFLAENELKFNETTEEETLNDEDIDQINMLLYTKERFNLSNDAYHELSMVCKELPRSWKIQERIKKLNKK